MQQLENITIETFRNIAMLKLATAQVGISDQQVGNAQDQIVKGQALVAQTRATIAGKESEIADHDSFWTQLGDYINGMKSIVDAVPKDTQSAVGTSIAMEAGDASTTTSGLLGIGTSISIMAGIGAFWVASYFTLDSMKTAQDGRQGQLTALKTQNLHAAEAELDIAQRTSQIAVLNQEIARADADLAQSLAYFTHTRFLNAEFWLYLAVLFQRILQLCLDLAARTGWLAEPWDPPWPSLLFSNRVEKIVLI